jgi:hypothetical protein
MTRSAAANSAMASCSREPCRTKRQVRKGEKRRAARWITVGQHVHFGTKVEGEDDGEEKGKGHTRVVAKFSR